MRWWASAVFFLSAPVYGQSSMPVGILRGDVVSWNTTELMVRNSDNAIYTCSYDTRTYVERNHWPIRIANLAAGDAVEVMADHKFGSTNCYVRTVHVVDRQAQRFAAVLKRRPPPEVFKLRGDMTVGGVVLRHKSFSLTVKTRNGEVTFLLRPDTRYVGDGLRLNPEAVEVNSHVFIRGGRDLEGDLEAYQVVWGRILHQ
jgi:hypothetical protein